MRVLMTVQFDTQISNQAIKDGSLPKLIQAFAERYRPEAAYFTVHNGDRTAYFVYDLADVSQMPVIAEPFFMGLGAKIHTVPAMSTDDLQRGLQTLAAGA